MTVYVKSWEILVMEFIFSIFKWKHSFSGIFRWDTHLYMSIFPSVCPSICQSVHCAPYLSNHTSCEHNFWCTCVKWYLQVFFPLLRQFRRIYCFFLNPLPKNWIFQWSPMKSGFSIWGMQSIVHASAYT